MNTHILKEEEFDTFIHKEILPLITRSRVKPGMTGNITRPRNKFGVTDDSLGVTNTVVALVGELGAGKTTFSKKLLKILGVHEAVTSPTFSIINSYDINFSDFTKALHVDVYRIEDSNELDVLHFDEMIQESNTLSIIEWADTIKEKIPKGALWIYFEHDGVETRKVSIDENPQRTNYKIPGQARDDKSGAQE